MVMMMMSTFPPGTLATLFYPRAPRSRLIRLSSLIDSTLFCDEILKNAPAKRAVYQQFRVLGVWGINM
jgi:hypothetical protein